MDHSRLHTRDHHSFGSFAQSASKTVASSLQMAKMRLFLIGHVDRIAHPTVALCGVHAIYPSTSAFHALSSQKEVQAADKPAREKNSEAFLTAQASVEKKFAEFMELFNDVPSEL